MAANKQMAAMVHAKKVEAMRIQKAEKVWESVQATNKVTNINNAVFVALLGPGSAQPWHLLRQDEACVVLS